MSDSEEGSDDGGGLFGSIGFMFDTARQKVAKDFTIFVDVDGHVCQDSRPELATSTQVTKMNSKEVNISLFIIDDDPGHVISGQYLWPAAFSLSRHLMQHWYTDIMPRIAPKTTLDSSNLQQQVPPVVVELGSGVGMCGQFLGKFFCDIEKQKSQSEIGEFNSASSTSPTVILTDYDPGCLEMLSDSVELNELQSCCRVARVEWGKPLTSVFEIAPNIESDGTNCKSPFLIIGSDLLYCASVVKPLFTTVLSMLSLSATSKLSAGSESTMSDVLREEEYGNSCKPDPAIRCNNDGLFILASSFDIGEEVQREMDACCIEFGILQVEVQCLDLSRIEKQYRIQYFSKIN